MASAAAASSAAGAGPASGDLPPNQTLYVNNLNDKIKRADMKKTLYTSFSQFGRVMQIICKGSFKLKGQAWITFDDVSSAVTAKRQLTNCPIFGKPLVSLVVSMGWLVASPSRSSGSTARSFVPVSRFFRIWLVPLV